MLNKCLACYQGIEKGDYHPRCSKNLFGTETAPSLDLNLEQIEEMARKIVRRGYTLPGVQRKLSLSLEDAQENKGRLTIIGAFGGTHILKPPTPTYPEMPEIENLTMLMASKCGIKTTAHGLIRMQDNSLAYITRRFDRIGKKKKLAVEDLCQLSELPSENKYKSTSEKAGKVIRKYSSNPGDDALKFVEVLVFSFVVGNSDMHLKNFSLMETSNGFVGMSPFYDLLSTALLINDSEELALMINGKKSNIKTEDFYALGENLKIPSKVIETCLRKQIDALPVLQAEISNGILSTQKKKEFLELVAHRCERIALRN